MSLSSKQLQKARASYTRHKNEARKRFDKHGKPIQFLLSFDEWLGIWLESGQFNNRGVKAGQYVMARKGDLGHYTKDNVQIQLSSLNVSEAKKGKPFGFRSPRQCLNKALTRRSAMSLTNDELKKARDSYNGKKKLSGKRKDKLGNPIEMRLSFEEWLKIWVDSGHFHERGVRKGQYVLSRKDDIGHYEIGNVFIQLATQNSREGKTGTKHSQSTRDEMSKNRKGKTKDQEHKDSIADAMALVPSVKCPHCGKSGQHAAMHRYHFERCKHKPQPAQFSGVLICTETAHGPTSTEIARVPVSTNSVLCADVLQRGGDAVDQVALLDDRGHGGTGGC